MSSSVRFRLDRHQHSAATRFDLKPVLESSQSVNFDTPLSMVFFFALREKATAAGFKVYMGKDKFENEDLLKYGWPEDVWFHVDGLSSAHVYLRMPPGRTIEDIPRPVVADCCQLVKANSIEGCKKSEVFVIYTPFPNLHKDTQRMEVGAVSMHDRKQVIRVKVEKDRDAVKRLEKTRVETRPDLAKELADRNAAEIRDKKNQRKADLKAKAKLAEERKRLKEEMSYDRVFAAAEMKSNTDMAVEATEDNSAAVEFEEDFM